MIRRSPGIISTNLLTNPKPGTLIRCFNLASVGSATYRVATPSDDDDGGSAIVNRTNPHNQVLFVFLITGHDYNYK